MIEIVVLYFACKRVGTILRGKGWRPLFLQCAVVVAWVVGAIVAGLSYEVVRVIREGESAVPTSGPWLYAWALVGGLAGLAAVFSLAMLLPSRLVRSSAMKT